MADKAEKIESAAVLAVGAIEASAATDSAQVKPVIGSFIVTKYSNYIYLILNNDPNEKMAEDYLKETLPVIENYGLDLVVNCDRLTKLNQSWVQAIIATEKALAKNKKRIRLILVRDEIKAMINEKGLSRILPVKANVRDALLSLDLVSNKSLDVGFVNPFLEATLRVLKIQALIEASAGKIYIKKDVSELSGDISGVIGLVSDSFSGNVIITFPEKTFLTLMSKMHGEEYTSINKENADGASELTNMIFGQAKVTLNDQGYGIKTALPSLIIGKSHRFTSNKQELVVVVPFQSDLGSFFVEICLADN